MTYIHHIENHCPDAAVDCVLIVNGEYYGFEFTGDPFMIKERVQNKEKAHVFRGTRGAFEIISDYTGSENEKNFKIIPAESLQLQSRKLGSELKKGESPMTHKQKLDEIHYILHTHGGDQASLRKKINDIVSWQNE